MWSQELSEAIEKNWTVLNARIQLADTAQHLNQVWNQIAVAHTLLVPMKLTQSTTDLIKELRRKVQDLLDFGGVNKIERNRLTTLLKQIPNP